MGKIRSMKTLALLFCVLLMSTATRADAENPPPDASLCGAYPTNYKEIVMKWLDAQLLDAGTARVEWSGEPKPADLGQNGQHLYGYLVNFTVNARNRFGAYTGKQQHGALIRDGAVVKGLGFGYQ
jgi:hypothetical protein